MVIAEQLLHSTTENLGPILIVSEGLPVKSKGFSMFSNCLKADAFTFYTKPSFIMVMAWHNIDIIHFICLLIILEKISRIPKLSFKNVLRWPTYPKIVLIYLR